MSERSIWDGNGIGRCPPKAEATGSNPVGCTNRKVPCLQWLGPPTPIAAITSPKSSLPLSGHTRGVLTWPLSGKSVFRAPAAPPRWRDRHGPALPRAASPLPAGRVFRKCISQRIFQPAAAQTGRPWAAQNRWKPCRIYGSCWPESKRPRHEGSHSGGWAGHAHQ